MTTNSHIDSVTDPLKYLEDKAKKEAKDVEASITSVKITIRGILMKLEKIKATDSKERLKEYRKQVKESNKYLDSLFASLRHEMIESVEADYKLEKARGTKR